MATQSTAVAVPIIDDEETLGSIKSFADAMQVLKDAGIEVHSTEEFGDGFTVCESKDDLVRMPFVILGMKLSQSDTYRDDSGNPAVFSIIRLVTETGKKLILTDGGTGINMQVQKYLSKGITSGLFVPKGLIKSEYTTDDGTPGTTFYLS